MLTQKHYVLRGFEELVIDTLISHKNATIVGVSGSGKSTTARYLATKLAELDFIPLIFQNSVGPSELPALTVESFPVENGQIVSLPIVSLPFTIFQSLTDFEATVNYYGKIAKDHLKTANLQEFTIEAVSRIDSQYLEVFSGVAKSISSAAEVSAITLPLHIMAALLVGASIVNLAVDLVNNRRSGLKSSKERSNDHKTSESDKLNLVLLLDDVVKPGTVSANSIMANFDWISLLSGSIPCAFMVTVYEESLLDFLKDRLGWLTWAPRIEKESQIFELSNTNASNLRDIIVANFEKIDELRINEITSLTGVPATAVLLYESNIKSEEFGYLIKNLENNRYVPYNQLTSMDDDHQRSESLKSNLSREYALSAALYYNLRARNFIFAALVFHPLGLTPEDMKLFCSKSKRYVSASGLKCYQNLYGDDMTLVERIPYVKDATLTKEVYRLTELWRHLSLKMRNLSLGKIPIENKRHEYIPGEAAAIRRILIEVLDTNGRKSPENAWRTSYSIMLQILFISQYKKSEEINKDKPDNWLLSYGLTWGTSLLYRDPEAGLDFFNTIYEMYEKSLKSPDLRSRMIMYLRAALNASYRFMDDMYDRNIVKIALEQIDEYSKNREIQFASCLTLSYILYLTVFRNDLKYGQVLINRTIMALDSFRQNVKDFESRLVLEKMLTNIGSVVTSNYHDVQLAISLLEESLGLQRYLIDNLENNLRLLVLKFGPRDALYLNDPVETIKTEILGDRVIVLRELGRIENLVGEFDAGQKHLSESWKVLPEDNRTYLNLDQFFSKLDYLDFDVTHNGLTKDHIEFLLEMQSTLLRKLGDLLPSGILGSIQLRNC